MAKVEYRTPILNIEGALAPGIICRQKKYKDGPKMELGPQEIFHQRKRDYQRHPLTEAEQRNTERFRLAEEKRKQEMADPERLAYWQTRFAAQQSKPETGNTKIYHRLNTFMRAMIMKEME